MSGGEEEIHTLPLDKTRRILGYVVPIMNFPLLAWKIYEITTGLSLGSLKLNSVDFLNDLIMISLSLVLLILIPQFSPIYPSQYWFTPTGLKIKRTLKGTKTLAYKTITRVDLYLREEKDGKPSKEALKYTRDSINDLREAGFKFIDFTNSELRIALVFSGDKVYMITPAYPKAFVQKLKRRTGKIKERTVELTPRGKRVRENA